MALQVNECAWRAAAGGTEPFTVASALTGFYTPAQCSTPAVVEGGEYHYRAESDDLTQHESGKGTYTAGVLTRDVVYQSSNGGEKVVFSAAPKVRLSIAAQDLEAAPTGPTSETITTGATETAASVDVDVTYIVSGGTGGVEAVSLPAPSGNWNEHIGQRHKFILQTLTPGDTVRIGPDYLNIILDQQEMWAEVEYNEVGNWVLYQGWVKANAVFTGVLKRSDYGGVFFDSNPGDIGSYTSMTAPGTVSTLVYTTYVSSDGSGTANPIAIANDYNGLSLIIGHRAVIRYDQQPNPSDSLSLAVSNILKSDGTMPASVTFTTVGQFLMLEWTGAAWEILDRRYNCTVA